MEVLLNKTRFCDAKKMVQSSLVSSLAYINEKAEPLQLQRSERPVTGIEESLIGQP